MVGYLVEWRVLDTAAGGVEVLLFLVVVVELAVVDAVLQIYLFARKYIEMIKRSSNQHNPLGR